MKRITVFIIVLVCFANTARSQENNTKYFDSNFASWDMAVIDKTKIMASLPFKLPIKSREIMNGKHMFKFIVADASQVNTKQFYFSSIYYGSLPVEMSKWVDKMPCKNNNKLFPKAWDVLNEKKIIVEQVNSLFDETTYKFAGDTKDDLENCYGIGGPDIVNQSKQKYDENGKPMVDEDGKAIVEPSKPELKDVVYYQVISTGENVFQLFLLRNNQFLVWEYDNNYLDEKWVFLYAFKIDKTEPYRICRIGYHLYIFMKDVGIYKLNISMAKGKRPKAPENVIVEVKEKSSFKVLKWDGFKQKHIVQNKVKAEKISELKYKSIVVDKNNKTAYFQVGDYFFEVTDLEHCVKMPIEKENLQFFANYEAFKMRLALKAIELLHKSPMKTPDIKTIMGASIEKPDNSNLDENSESNASKSQNNSKSVAKEKDLLQNSDETAKNLTHTGIENGLNPENMIEASAVGEQDSKEDPSNSQNENSNSENISFTDETDVLIYVGATTGLIILVSLIFVTLNLIRKKR